MAKQKQVEEIEENSTIENPQTENPQPEKVYHTLVSGAEYWDFDTNPTFVGKYIQPVIREKDQQLIGFLFVDEKGEDHIITNSHSVEKAIKMVNDMGVIEKATFVFEFLGKGEANGKPFNRFKIGYY